MSSWSKSSELIALNRCEESWHSLWASENWSAHIIKLEPLSTEFTELLLLLDSLATEQPLFLVSLLKSPTLSKLFSNSAGVSRSSFTKESLLSPTAEGEVTIFLSVSTEGLDDADATTGIGVSKWGLESVEGFSSFELPSETDQKKNKGINTRVSTWLESAQRREASSKSILSKCTTFQLHIHVQCKFHASKSILSYVSKINPPKSKSIKALLENSSFMFTQREWLQVFRLEDLTVLCTEVPSPIFNFFKHSVSWAK